MLWILWMFLHLSYGFIPTPKLSSTAIRRRCTQNPGFENESRDTIFVKLEELLEEDTSAARLSLFNTRLTNIKLDRTTVMPSTVVAGQRGLFASCDCSQGDLLTCYPGDLLILIPDEGDYTILTGAHVEDKKFEDKEYDISDELMGYLLHATDDYGVLGLPWLDDDPAYLGHFANDGAVNPTKAKDVDTYVSESLAKANVRHDMISCHMVTVATRDIAKGEEILVSYGPDYWMDHSDFE
jgi:hypothetical protein